MNRFFVLLAAAALASSVVFGAARAATVYIPEGSAGDVLVVDAKTDTAVRRIDGLPVIHGLGGAAKARYLVAGSLVETPIDQVPAVAKPSGVSEEEHAAHHGGAARSRHSAKGVVSILTIISVADGSPVRRLEVPGAVHHVAVSPDGRYAVATHPNAEGVSVIDLTDLSVRRLVRTGPTPNYAAFSPDGTDVYVSNAGNGTVSEIDTKRWFVRRNILAGEMPEHIVMAPDGRTLYVANVKVGTVSAIDIKRGEIARTFAIGGELHGIDVSDDGGKLFVSVTGEDKLAVVDLKSGSVRKTPLGPAPYHLAVIHGTGKLYVSSRAAPTVWVVDQKTLTMRGSIPVRGEGHQMVVLP